MEDCLGSATSEGVEGLVAVRSSATSKLSSAEGERHGYECKAYNLLVRLDTQRAAILRFCSDFSIVVRKVTI